MTNAAREDFGPSDGRWIIRPRSGERLWAKSKEESIRIKKPLSEESQENHHSTLASGGNAPARGNHISTSSASGRYVPACGGGGGSASSTRSVSFRSSPVVPSIAPPLGTSRQDEYELLSRARSHVKSRGESGPQSSAGAESFGEAEALTGSTPDRNSNLPLERSSGRSSRGKGYDRPDDDGSDSSSSSSSSSGRGGGGGGGDGDDPNGVGRSPNRRRKKCRRKDKAEAGEIKLETLKPIAKYPEWCSSLADAVMAASGRGDKVWDWIQAPSYRNATMGAMAYPGSKYRSSRKRCVLLLTATLFTRPGSKRNSFGTPLRRSPWVAPSEADSCF